MKHAGIITIVLLASVFTLLCSCNSNKGQESATRSANYVVEGGIDRGKVWKDTRQYEQTALLENLYDDGLHDHNNAAIKTLLDLDIIFEDTGDMPWVKFPHMAHTKWLDCSNCHPEIFIPKKGANNPSMDGILAGEHCGRCHDKVAFALWICERCHSVPHQGSPGKWWGDHRDDRFKNVENQNAKQ